MVAVAVEAAAASSSSSSSSGTVFLKGFSVAESAVVLSDKVLSEADLHVLVFVAVELDTSLISDTNAGNKVVVLPVAAAIPDALFISAVAVAVLSSRVASAVFLKGVSVAEPPEVVPDKVLSEADLHVLAFVAVELATSLISDTNVGNEMVVLPVVATIVSLGKLPDGKVEYASVSLVAVVVLSSGVASAAFLNGVSVAESPEVVPDKVLSKAELLVLLFVAVMFATSFISDAVVSN